MGSMGHTGQECCIGIRRPANGQMLYTGRDGCEILANLISEGQKKMTSVCCWIWWQTVQEHDFNTWFYTTKIISCLQHIISVIKCFNSSIYTYLLHSSEIRGLRSTNCYSETLQNLLYFMYKKTHVGFFILCNFIFLPYEWPGLCRHRPGHS